MGPEWPSFGWLSSGVGGLHVKRYSYVVLSVFVRIGWITAALGNITILKLKYMAFVLEIAVLLLLIYEVNPEVLKGLDPSDHNFFKNDQGIQILIPVASLLMSIPWIIIIGKAAHLPHSLSKFGHNQIKTFTEGITVLVGLFLTLSLPIGIYVHLRDSGENGIVIRMLRSFSGSEDISMAPKRRDNQTASSDKYYHLAFLINKFIIILTAGIITTFAALIWSVFIVAVLVAPRFLVIVVVIWLAYDIWTHFFELKHGWSALIWQVSEEVEKPKKWFMAMDFPRLNFKGYMALFFLSLLISITMGILSIFVFLSIKLFTLGGGVIIHRTGDLVSLSTTMIMLLFNLEITFIPLSLGGYLMVVWFSLLQRLPGWIDTFPSINKQTVNSYSLPYKCDFFVPTLCFGYMMNIHLLEATSNQSFTILTVLPLVTLTTLHLITGYAIYRAKRSVSSTEIKLSKLAIDDHRIMAYFVVFLSSLSLILGVVAKMFAILLLGVLLYYSDNFRYFVKGKVAAPSRARKLHLSYMNVIALTFAIYLHLFFPDSSPLVVFLLIMIPLSYLVSLVDDFFEVKD